MKVLKKAMVFLFCAFFSVALIACEEEPEGVCTYDISSTQTPHRISSARVFYPCDIDTMAGVHSTTLTSGIGGSKENMYWLAEPIAAEGMVVIAVSASNSSSVSGYETAHRSGVAILQDENDDPGSPLYGSIASYGVMGYSMGGGGSINAGTSLGNEIETCIALAPAPSSPGASHTAATLILTGSADMTCPPSYGSSAYGNLDFIDARGYASMSGKSHTFWVNNYNPGTADDYIIAWLKYFGEGDISYGATIENPGSDMTDVRLDAPPLTPTGDSSDDSPWWWW
jgi:dienelactone hydrolase